MTPRLVEPGQKAKEVAALPKLSGSSALLPACPRPRRVGVRLLQLLLLALAAWVLSSWLNSSKAAAEAPPQSHPVAAALGGVREVVASVVQNANAEISAARPPAFRPVSPAAPSGFAPSVNTTAKTPAFKSLAARAPEHRTAKPSAVPTRPARSATGLVTKVVARTIATAPLPTAATALSGLTTPLLDKVNAVVATADATVDQLVGTLNTAVQRLASSVETVLKPVVGPVLGPIVGPIVGALPTSPPTGPSAVGASAALKTDLLPVSHTDLRAKSAHAAATVAASSLEPRSRWAEPAVKSVPAGTLLDAPKQANAPVRPIPARQPAPLPTAPSLPATSVVTSAHSNGSAATVDLSGFGQPGLVAAGSARRSAQDVNPQNISDDPPFSPD